MEKFQLKKERGKLLVRQQLSTTARVEHPLNAEAFREALAAATSSSMEILFSVYLRGFPAYCRVYRIEPIPPPPDEAARNKSFDKSLAFVHTANLGIQSLSRRCRQSSILARLICAARKCIRGPPFNPLIHS